jgi:hypothetical protein
MIHPKIKPMAGHPVILPDAAGGTGLIRQIAGRGAKIMFSVLTRAGELISGAGWVYGAGGRPPKY